MSSSKGAGPLDAPCHTYKYWFHPILAYILILRLAIVPIPIRDTSVNSAQIGSYASRSLIFADLVYRWNSLQPTRSVTGVAAYSQPQECSVHINVRKSPIFIDNWYLQVFVPSFLLATAVPQFIRSALQGIVRITTGQLSRILHRFKSAVNLEPYPQKSPYCCKDFCVRIANVKHPQLKTFCLRSLQGSSFRYSEVL